MAAGQLHAFIRHLRSMMRAEHGGGLLDAELLERFTTLRDEAAFEVLLWSARLAPSATSHGFPLHWPQGHSKPNSRRRQRRPWSGSPGGVLTGDDLWIPWTAMATMLEPVCW